MIKLTRSLFVLTLLLSHSQAFAWGRYGHEQINKAALELLKKNKFSVASCLAKNEPTVLRLSITPDFDWKKKTSGDSEEDKKAARQKTIETPTHFVELDAYVPTGELMDSDLLQFPNATFPTAYPNLLERAVDNNKQVGKLNARKMLRNPNSATYEEILGHGTAPWRVMQFYDLTVAALKSKDFRKAIFFMGIMGHYVGDIAQPLHVTVSFDGQLSPTATSGVHASFESAMFDYAAEQSGAKLDRNTLLWSDFSVTHDRVVLAARKTQNDTLNRHNIFQNLVELAHTGYSEMPVVTEAFAKQCAKFAAKYPKRKYCEPVERGRYPHTDDELIAAYLRDVGSIAIKRLGEASSMLARIWASAISESKLGQKQMQECPAVPFNSLNTEENYVLPAYIKI